MKKTKKAFSLLLAFIMLFSVLTFSAYAAAPDNSDQSQAIKQPGETQSISGSYFVVWSIPPDTFAAEAPWYLIVIGQNGSQWKTPIYEPEGATNSPIYVVQYVTVPWWQLPLYGYTI